MSDRDTQRTHFIAASGWGDAVIEPLPEDASARRYFRLRMKGDTRILMDAPAEKGQEVGPFVKVANHLASLGLSAPEIYAADEDQGFLLLEDFGTATFTRLLADGHDERRLYELATDSLIHLQRAPGVMAVDTSSYLTRLLPQIDWLLEWYYRDVTGRMASEEVNRSFYDAWGEMLAVMPAPRTTLMLRDYHVDNLILLDRPGVKACGLLDFQAAQFAPAPYDLVCLLEDGRRDVPVALREAMLARYGVFFPIDESFRAWYAVLSAHRHMRVLGNFARQSLLHNKHGYRVHLPRVQAYLDASLANTHLAPLAVWWTRWIGGGTQA